MSFFNELKRRNVIRVATAYVVVSWLIIQVAETIFPVYGLGDAAIRSVITALAVAFIPTLIFSWVFEITPEGLKREVDVVREHSITRFTGKKLDRIIMLLLALALGYFAFDKFVLDPFEDVQIAESAHEEGRSEALIESYGDKSIAVLPFVNMSADPEQEYFSDGISEELLNLLAKLPGLRVIARTSSFAYKGKDVKIADIAQELNVAHILEGSVRKSGNQVRITAQLIRSADSSHLWSATYDRTLDNIFAIQDEIAAEVVSALKITLLGGTAPKTKETNPEAYAYYLQGKHFAMMSQFREAKELLDKALAIDPDYAPVWERLANICVNQAIHSSEGFDEGYRQARTFNDKAMKLDPGFAAAHAQRAWIAMMYERNLSAAAAHLEKALALAPMDAKVLGVSGVFMETLGRLDEAIELGKQAKTVDPLNPIIYSNIATQYSYVGQLDEAEAMYEKSLEFRPDDDYVLSHLAILHSLQGRPDKALSVAERVDFQKSRLWAKSIAHHDLGQAEESDAALAALKEGYADSAAAYIAAVHAWRGEIDSAFEWLNRAIDENEYMWGSAPFDPAFNNLHDDPRWQLFRARVGRSEEQLAEIDFQI